MLISFVVAMSENRVIGRNGQLPWKLSNDLRRFKELTIGKNILMGRKTFESINKPLPNRNNFVLTRNDDFNRNDLVIFHSKEDVLKSNIKELIVIGGADIYELFLPECQRIYLTLVHTIIDGDIYFPHFFGFLEKSRQFYRHDEKHQYDYSFIEYERNEGGCSM